LTFIKVHSQRNSNPIVKINRRTNLALYTQVMKTSFETFASTCHHSSEREKSVSLGTTVSKVGAVTILRSTRHGKNGQLEVVAVASASRTRLARETTKQLLAIIAKPITREQRHKAEHLAKSAKDAHQTAATAKFRRLVA
jgi:hypothetical protein